MSAWDPSTGASVGGDDLAALIAAAQPVGDKPTRTWTTRRSSRECRWCTRTRWSRRSGAPWWSPTSGRTAPPTSLCRTTSTPRPRACAPFLQSIPEGDAHSRVKIECGAMGAMACKDQNNRGYLTTWMDKALAAQHGHQPTFILMPPQHLSHWALQMVTMFEGASAAHSSCSR